MILQLSPPLPVVTPRGKALAHFLIDYGMENDLHWVCFLDESGECWTFQNPDIRAQKNITQEREHISPFYEPESVALPQKKEKVCPHPAHTIVFECALCDLIDCVLCKDAPNWKCPRCQGVISDDNKKK